MQYVVENELSGSLYGPFDSRDAAEEYKDSYPKKRGCPPGYTPKLTVRRLYTIAA